MILIAQDIHHEKEIDNDIFTMQYQDYRIVKRDFDWIGFFVWQQVGNSLYFQDSFSHHLSMSEMHQYLNLVTEFFLKTIKPERIIYTGMDQLQQFLKYGNQHLYYQKGKQWQRIVEPWRYVISERVFDDEGYIIDQDKMEILPFGLTNSKRSGCGWIAAYNLLKLNHQEKTMSEVFFGLSEVGIAGEIFGQNIYLLYLWLRKKGLKVHMRHISRNQCVKQMKNSSSGIFLYIHKRGSHFTTYENLKDGTFKFYNAVYGKKNMILNIEQFIHTYTFLPIGFLLYIN